MAAVVTPANNGLNSTIKQQQNKLSATESTEKLVVADDDEPVIVTGKSEEQQTDVVPEAENCADLLLDNQEKLEENEKNPIHDEFDEFEEFRLTEREQLELRHSVARMLQPGKGILAADDSVEAMGSRLMACSLENTAENRRRYRQLLFTTPNLGKHISAVILHEDTYRQCTDRGDRLADLLRRQGIAVGIKVDADPVPLVPPPAHRAQEHWRGETITQGLDNLLERLSEYKQGGCVFAKWRCAFRISARTPSQMALEQNAMVMARYAMICQRVGLVPIVEPDVIGEGTHSIEACQQATEKVLVYIMKALTDHNIFMEGIVIKMNMVTAGFQADWQPTPEHVAEMTLLTLKRAIPAAVSGIAFLSGGQSELTATRNLSAINKLVGPTGTNTKPWQLTFCFGRALQENVMPIWRGDSENVGAAQKQFLHRAHANAEAEQGKYESEKAVAAALSGITFMTGPTRYY